MVFFPLYYRAIADAAIAVVRAVTKKVDVIKFDVS